MNQPEMRLLQGHNLKINVAIWPGKSSTILCVHGITANCRTWDMMANELSPHHQVLAVDLRGRGLSDKPETGYSPEAHIQDLLSIMDDLKLDKVFLMGHSLGAFISLVFAATHPERVEKLVLVDGAGELDKEQMDNVFQGIKPALDRLELNFESAQDYLNFMKASPSVQPWLPHIETYYRHEIEKTSDGFKTNIKVEHIIEESGNVRKIDCSSHYNKVECPTLILRADQGLLSDADLLLPEDVIQEMMMKIPNARRFDVKGTNHYGILFQPHPERDKTVQDFFSF